MGWVRSANRLANKPYRQSAGFVQNANQFLETEKRQFPDFQTENRTKLTLYLERVPTFEPAAQEAGKRCLQNIGMTSFFNIHSQRTTRLICLWRLYFFVFLGSI